MIAIGSPPSNHMVVLYRTDEFVARTVLDFVREGIEQGEAAVVISSPERREAIRAGLPESYHRLVTWLDAAEVLARLLEHPPLDTAALRTVLQPVIAAARASSTVGGVRLFGDLASLLWKRDLALAANGLETAWHHLLKEEPATLLCACEADPLDLDHAAEPLLALCRAHGHLAASEDGNRRQRVVRAAMDEVLGAREAARLELLRAAAGLPTASEGGDDLTLLWLRTVAPHLAHRVIARCRRVIPIGPDLVTAT